MKFAKPVSAISNTDEISKFQGHPLFMNCNENKFVKN
jgi:hypothetical protein